MRRNKQFLTELQVYCGFCNAKIPEPMKSLTCMFCGTTMPSLVDPTVLEAKEKWRKGLVSG